MRRIEAYDAKTVTASRALVEGRPSLQYHGFAVRENDDPPGGAAFTIRHGGTDGNAYPALTPVGLAANESKTEGPWVIGVAAPRGIFVELESGEVAVVVFASADDDADLASIGMPPRGGQ